MLKSSYGFFAAIFGWGLINLILTSKLAEYRIDDISADGGMGNDWSSILKRFSRANYTCRGQQLLPALVLSAAGQLIALFVWLLFLD
jgi:hypothetical protein